MRLAMSHDDWRLLRYAIVLIIILCFIVWKIESRLLAKALFAAAAVALYLYSKRGGRDETISFEDDPSPDTDKSGTKIEERHGGAQDYILDTR